MISGLMQKTDIGMIPADWELRPLAELGEPKIGLTYSPADVRESGTLVLRSSNVQNDRLAFGDNVYVRSEIANGSLVEPGDILICVRNGSRALIGKCALIDESAKGMAFGAFMSVFRSPHSAFLFQQFRSDIIGRQIAEHLGATINQITNGSLKSFRVPFPPNAEERGRIAKALNDIDDLIASLDALIAKKRDVKQGAMKGLLTGQRRLAGFSGKWDEVTLGGLGVFLKGAGVRRDQAQSGEIPCVRYGELYTRHHNIIRSFGSYVSRNVAATATPLKFGDILFAGSGETKEEIGKCAAFLGTHEAVAGGDIIIFRPKGQCSSYLGYVLNLPAVAQQKAGYAQGDAVVHVASASLARITLRIPKLGEQKAIAGVIEAFASELEALVDRRTKLLRVRQGMMQQLLTGRIRLV